MKSLWFFFFISFLAVESSMSQARVDSVSDSVYMDDTWIGGGVNAAWNNGWDSLLLANTQTGKKILIRLNNFGWALPPVGNAIDSLLLSMELDSCVITADRVDSAFLCRRDWQEGELFRADATLLPGCNGTKYYTTDDPTDLNWTTAVCDNTTTDRTGTAFDWEPITTLDIVGNRKVWILRDTSILRQMREQSAYTGGVLIWQASGSGQQHGYGSLEKNTATDRPFFKIFSHTPVVGTNQRIANGVLGMRLRAGTVGKRSKPDYGY